jgi:hypothetical protein
MQVLNAADGNSYVHDGAVMADAARMRTDGVYIQRQP